VPEFEAMLGRQFDTLYHEGETIPRVMAIAVHPFVTISRSTSRPPSDDSQPPSKRAATALPWTGDRPGRSSVRSTMAGVASVPADSVSATESYAPSMACATPASHHA
jgi:hypothetical protein